MEVYYILTVRMCAGFLEIILKKCMIIVLIIQLFIHFAILIYLIGSKGIACILDGCLV